MKINPKHNKAVANAAHELRKTLTEHTIALLKLIGAESGQDVVFDKILILHERKKNGIMETILVDRLCYSENGKPSYITEMDGKFHWSFYLSLDSMETIYDEVYKLVRKY